MLVPFAAKNQARTIYVDTTEIVHVFEAVEPDDDMFVFVVMNLACGKKVETSESIENVVSKINSSRK